MFVIVIIFTDFLFIITIIIIILAAKYIYLFFYKFSVFIYVKDIVYFSFSWFNPMVELWTYLVPKFKKYIFIIFLKLTLKRIFPRKTLKNYNWNFIKLNY